MEDKPYLRKLDLPSARNKWEESEWHLSFLRSEGNEPKPTEEEILLWFQDCQT
jgi:hypothetical protein